MFGKLCSFAAWFWSFFKQRDVSDGSAIASGRLAYGPCWDREHLIPWHCPLINYADPFVLGRCGPPGAPRGWCNEEIKKDMKDWLAAGCLALASSSTASKPNEYVQCRLRLLRAINLRANFFMADGFFHGAHVIIGYHFPVHSAYAGAPPITSPRKAYRFEAPLGIGIRRLWCGCSCFCLHLCLGA